jgi:MoaA/NifB/PqqE/SkfB family radical SAM enzyme
MTTQELQTIENFLEELKDLKEKGIRTFGLPMSKKNYNIDEITEILKKVKKD